MEGLIAKTASLYGPLDPNRQEIRILHLCPATSLTEPVQYHLEMVSLQSDPRPQHEAISYVWSEHVGMAPITVNDKLVEDAPASAANVLRQFRLESATRKIWINALCINQADIEE